MFLAHRRPLNLNPPPPPIHTNRHTCTPIYCHCEQCVKFFLTTDDWYSAPCLVCVQVFFVQKKVLIVDTDIFSVVPREWVLIIQCVDIIITFFQNSGNQDTSIPLQKYCYSKRLKLGILEIVIPNTRWKPLILGDHVVLLGCWTGKM
jgi:hypothetical protein